MTDTKPVEIQIRRSIHDRATARAAQQSADLAAIAKQIVWQAARAARPVDDPRPWPDRIERGVVRKRLRMVVPTAEWDTARDRLRAAGKSVASVIEDGLTHYADTGVAVLPIPNPERTRKS